ncbi:MAG TPA: rhodanese-like domain-containing protein [Succinivibrionaceae bacterium]|nr:rhodanese-like domain-containing protein [Succinivibrionaceae bacterium]
MSELFSPENLSEYVAFFQRHYMICGGWIVVLCVFVYMQIKIMTSKVKKASSNLATMMVNHEDGVFVDIRSQNLFSSGHIANSINITAGEIKEGKLNRIANSKEKPVIIVGKDKFDTDCFNSARLLMKQGYSKVFTLEGGIMQWATDNLPLSNKK